MENRDHQEYLDQEATAEKTACQVLKVLLDLRVLMVKEELQVLQVQEASRYF